MNGIILVSLYYIPTSEKNAIISFINISLFKHFIMFTFEEKSYKKFNNAIHDNHKNRATFNQACKWCKMAKSRQDTKHRRLVFLFCV